jgi:hypothetical protein
VASAARRAGSGSAASRSPRKFAALRRRISPAWWPQPGSMPSGTLTVRPLRLSRHGTGLSGGACVSSRQPSAPASARVAWRTLHLHIQPFGG